MRLCAFCTFAASLASYDLVAAELTWTNCDIILDDRQAWDSVKRAKQWDVALDMLNVTNHRLDELLQAAQTAQWLGILENKPAAVKMEDRSDKFVSAFRTTVNLLSPKSTSHRPHPFELVKDGAEYELIERALRLSTAMEHNMRNSWRLQLNLQISCDSSWLKHVEGRRYRDNRVAGLFADPTNPQRTEVEIPWNVKSTHRPLDERDNGRIWYVMNDLAPTFTSVVSINSYYLEQAIRDFDTEGHAVDYGDIKDEKTGEDGVPSYSYSLPDITHTHLSAWLIGAIAASKPMTTDRNGAILALPVTHCPELTDVYAYDQLACVLANARDPGVGMADLNFQYLVVALYMEKEDYSTGWNKNLLEVRHKHNEGLEFDRDDETHAPDDETHVPEDDETSVTEGGAEPNAFPPLQAENTDASPTTSREPKTTQASPGHISPISVNEGSAETVDPSPSPSSDIGAGLDADGDTMMLDAPSSFPSEHPRLDADGDTMMTDTPDIDYDGQVSPAGIDADGDTIVIDMGDHDNPSQLQQLGGHPNAATEPSAPPTNLENGQVTPNHGDASSSSHGSTRTGSRGRARAGGISSGSMAVFGTRFRPNSGSGLGRGSRQNTKRNQDTNPATASDADPHRSRGLARLQNRDIDSTFSSVSDPGSALRPNTKLDFEPTTFVVNNQPAENLRPGAGANRVSKPHDTTSWTTRAAPRKSQHPRRNRRERVRRSMPALVEVH